MDIMLILLLALNALLLTLIYYSLYDRLALLKKVMDEVVTRLILQGTVDERFLETLERMEHRLSLVPMKRAKRSGAKEEASLPSS